MKHLRLFAATISLAVLTACAALGIGTPKAFTDRVAAAQITVTGIRSAALQLLNTGAIGQRDAKNAQATADAGNEAIDLAMTFYNQACPIAMPPAGASAPPMPDPTCSSSAATAKLDAAIAVLTAAQVYLATKGAK